MKELENTDGDRVAGTTNVINQTDTYVNTGSMADAVEIINHDAAHQNGQGEAAAHVMGKTGNAAFNLGTWANSGDIADAKSTITPTQVTNAAKTQQELLAEQKAEDDFLESNQAKLETQQETGDEFENAIGGPVERREAFPNLTKEERQRLVAKQIYEGDIYAQNKYLEGVRSVGSSALVDEIKGISDSILHPVVTIKGIIQLFASPYDNGKALYMQARDWYALKAEAKINDPYLYGVMSAQEGAKVFLGLISMPVGGAAANAIKGTRQIPIIHHRSATNGYEPDNDLLSNQPSGRRELAQGLNGKDFEEWLQTRYGGQESFSINGREFDGAIGNRWFEAKSGNYWRDVTSTDRGFNKFKSDMGARKKIADNNGATYELHSNTPIPENIKDWLESKNIPYYEHQ